MDILVFKPFDSSFVHAFKLLIYFASKALEVAVEMFKLILHMFFEMLGLVENEFFKSVLEILSEVCLEVF